MNYASPKLTTQEWALPLLMRAKIIRAYDEQWDAYIDTLVKWRGWECVKSTHFVGYRTVECDATDRLEMAGYPHPSLKDVSERAYVVMAARAVELLRGE